MADFFCGRDYAPFGPLAIWRDRARPQRPFPLRRAAGIDGLVGACLGWGVAIVFHAMTVAGELIGHASGLSIAEVLDPDLEENVPLISRMLYLMALAVFLAIGGHRLVLAGLLDTFQAIPPGSGRLPGSLAEGIATLLAESFSLGLRAAAPTVTALLVATLAAGLWLEPCRN